MRRALWAVLILAQTAFSADYVPWRREFSIFCPTILSHQRPALAGVQPQALPFSAPTMSFAATPVHLKAPFEAKEALLFEEPYFYATQSAETAPAEVIVGVSRIKLDSAEGLPQRFVAVKTVADVTLLAAWPKDATEESRKALRSAVQEELQGAAPGEYSGRVE